MTAKRKRLNILAGYFVLLIAAGICKEAPIMIDRWNDGHFSNWNYLTVAAINSVLFAVHHLITILSAIILIVVLVWDFDAKKKKVEQVKH